MISPFLSDQPLLVPKDGSPTQENLARQRPTQFLIRDGRKAAQNESVYSPKEGASKEDSRVLRDMLFLILFFILAGVWLISWAAFHVAGGLIHILLVFAIISLVVHFVRAS